MIKNIIIIVVILIALGLIITHYIKALSKDLVEEEITPKYSLDYLTQIVEEAFSNKLKENLRELSLPKAELAAERRKKILLRKYTHDATYGDQVAKKYVKDAIKSVLLDPSVGIDTNSVNATIPFKNPEKLTMRQKADIVFHIYKSLYKEEAFTRFMLDNNLEKPKNISIQEEMKGALKYVVTKDELNEIYDDLTSQHALTFDDKFEIIAQYIFSQNYGLGVIDELYSMNLDEIDGGSGGIAYKEVLKNKGLSYLNYSYEDIRVTFKGVKYKLDFLSFESQKELERITRNIYKYDARHALTESNAHIIETMKDGSRIAAIRPKEGGGYAFWLRKYTSVSSCPTFEELYKDLGNVEIPKAVIKHAVYSQSSLVVSGPMNAGKSTLIKVLIGFIPSEKAIRTLESNFELDLSSVYGTRNCFPFAVTEATTMQELFDFIKKSNADVVVVGEAASHAECVIALQATQNGSDMTITTEHSTTTENFITRFSDSLLSNAGYTDKLAAEKVVVQGFHFDIHLASYQGIRYIERITEIVPVEDSRYPSEIAKDNGDTKIIPGGAEDTLEYYKRQTDRKSYKCVNIVEFSLEDMSYHMTNPISNTRYKSMLSKLSGKNKETFINDMNLLNSLVGR